MLESAATAPDPQGLLFSFLTLLGVLGVIGVLGMTWLFPVLSFFWAKLRRVHPQPSTFTRATASRTLQVLLPVHNGARSLGQTLASILASIEQAQRSFPGVRFRVRVGADGCEDNTAEIARAHPGVEVVEFAAKQGKWVTLRSLFESGADADWVAFADVGVLWPEDLIERALEAFASRDVAAVAPTYRNPSGGWLENCAWHLESHFKAIESGAGGPVSIHGATIFYEKHSLNRAYAWLSELRRTKVWFNDDVVLPLLIRALTNQRIVYLTETSVADTPDVPAALRVSGSRPVAREFGRRRRMVQGNLQWIRWILPRLWLEQKTVAFLAMRRVFRLLWAYWVLFAYAGFLSLLGITLTGVLGAVQASALLFFLAAVPVLFLFVFRDAMLASLMVPVYWARESLSPGMTETPWS